MQAVVECGGEELGGAARDRGAEEGGTAGRVGGVGVRDGVGEGCAGLGGADALVRDQRDRVRRQAVRDARDPAGPGEADAARERGGEVVGMPFEVDAECEELLVVRFAAGRERSGDEAERDGRGAGAEPALARDPVGEGEREAVRRVQAREGPKREVVQSPDLVLFQH